MKRSTFLTIAMTAVLAGSAGAQASGGHSGHTAGSQAANPEEAAVREAVNHYLLAHATGVGDHLKGVFHPELNLYWSANGTFTKRAGTEYIAGFRGTPPADEAQRKRWIEMVDVSGNAAIAKVVLDYPATKFVDYFTLLKIDGKWQIMNKTFNATPKN